MLTRTLPMINEAEKITKILNNRQQIEFGEMVNDGKSFHAITHSMNKCIIKTLIKDN